MKSIRLASLLVSSVLLTSCGFFGDKDEELQPKELVEISPRVKVTRLWSTSVGGDAEFLQLGLRPVGDGSRIYAASRDGNVVALQPETGNKRWAIETDMDLSAGPAAADGVVAVGSMDGYILLLDADDGSELWRTYVGAETLAQPIIGDESIIVQTIDNRLQSLSRFDGRLRWEIEQSMPALTMRGGSSPVRVGSTVVAGFDNGRLVAVSMETGDVQWDTLLALPTGRSDLDRLSDIDGAIAVVGQDVYAAGYQGRIGGLAAESGQVLWQREISTHVGVAADWNNVYTTRSDGEIIALSRRTGAESWRNDALLRREPTLPVSYQNTVVSGDFEGYLHFLSSFDGSIVARLRSGGEAISAPPIVVGNQLYVQSDNGSVAAYQIVDDRPERPVPDISDQG